jgi:hypothetical protein
LLCFLDCYSGYHQIAIKEEDQEKTAFITPFGAYCYTTMSFGLMNAGATYQRAIRACYKRQLNKNVEAYVDDVVVKTKDSSTLIYDLEETFASLREYRWKLNPNKCVFSVPSGKLLGFIISHCGIEANPEKISAITSTKAPTCIKDVQKLTGCMAALLQTTQAPREVRVDHRGGPRPCSAQGLPIKATSPHGFSQRRAATALPRCDYSHGQYCHLCRAAGRRPRLSSPAPSLLVSEVLSESKARYQPVQKLLYAVLITSRKLRHYFQEYSISVVTDYPLSDILRNQDATGRISKWAVKLGALTIDFKPRTTIKSHALVDFTAEWRENQLPTPTERPEHWVMYFDGSLNLEAQVQGYS